MEGEERVVRLSIDGGEVCSAGLRVQGLGLRAQVLHPNPPASKPQTLYPDPLTRWS